MTLALDGLAGGAAGLRVMIRLFRIVAATSFVLMPLEALIAAPTDSGAMTAAAEAPVVLPRFEVREKEITDFGMSVVTNLGVLFGRKITWMRVGAVVPLSSATLAGLKTNDEILSINDVPLAKISRREMLSTFFSRPFGARVKLLVKDANTRHLRFVEMAAGAVRPDARKRR